MEEENKNIPPLPPDEQPDVTNASEQEQHETINPQHETPNPQHETTQDMEVHHHAHENHGKKTWKSYFWEFLMLFLAVFCGFLAEYQLEHVIENQREKVYVRSMIEDLQNDHDALDRYINNMGTRLAQMDSLVTLLNDEKNLDKNGNLLYYFGRISPRLDFFSNNNRTFDQLRNSGGFRLIRNNKASANIMEYYGSLQFIRNLEDLFFQEFTQYKNLAANIFDPIVLRSMEMPDGNISREASNPALQTRDPQLLKQLAVFAVYMNGSRRSILPAAQALQKKAADLITLLKNAYHL